ncbi:MAG TPA: FAD-binding oxidoreductase [bacterium]|jgi:glycine/D-amino acid oxidase-like deaminating enzyme|nr:FAD-binding oxidoreductase [bacterium]
MTTADVVVIGGGSTGSSVAFQLARRLRGEQGRVLLVERDTVGAGPTSKSIGIIRLHYSYEPLVRMAQRSLALFSEFEELTGGTADFSRIGFLLLVSEPQMPTLRENVALQHALGVRAEVLSAEAVLDLDSRLAVDDAGGAAWEPDSGFADGYATATSFAAAARRHGAEIWEAATVSAIEVSGGRVRGVATSRGRVEAASVLVAAGPWTPPLLAPLGIDVPIVSARQQVVQLAPPPAFGPLRLVVEDLIQGLFARPEAGGTVLAGVLEEDAGDLVSPDVFRRGVDFDYVEHVGRMWGRRFPEAAQSDVRGGYASLYDVTPDWQPVLGAVDGIEGLFIAAGFSGHGFKLSPALGEVLAALITGEQPAVDVSAFRLSRFAEGRLLRGHHAQGILG